MKKVIYTENAPKPIGPYNQAILSNNTLYISGQIPVNPATGELVQSSIEDETRQVMHNLKAILTEANMDFSKVVKCSIFIKDMGQFANINSVYGEFFDDYAPARETVQVAELPLGVNVEISAIAIN
jgi:2-iminobutanoate/2-iminopropanoate deaminase